MTEYIERPERYEAIQYTDKPQEVLDWILERGGAAHLDPDGAVRFTAGGWVSLGEWVTYSRSGFGIFSAAEFMNQFEEA